MRPIFRLLPALALLGACTETYTGTPTGEVAPITEVPDQVVQMAAPGQDLSALRVLPEDGCYWYRYVGPVETTYLPLRTIDGRPICTRA